MCCGDLEKKMATKEMLQRCSIHCVWYTELLVPIYLASLAKSACSLRAL